MSWYWLWIGKAVEAGCVNASWIALRFIRIWYGRIGKLRLGNLWDGDVRSVPARSGSYGELCRGTAGKSRFDTAGTASQGLAMQVMIWQDELLYVTARQARRGS